MDYKMITAVTVNWLTAQRTLNAVKSFRKFYPDIPLVVVDDDSNPIYKSDFIQCYKDSWELEYDPNIEKLIDAQSEYNFTFLEVPPHQLHPKGHGNAVDFAMKHIVSEWMFHFHSDYRLTKWGILEEMSLYINDETCAIGSDKTKHQHIRAVSSVAALYNVDLGKKYGISFKPVVYYDDDQVKPFPGPANGGMPLEAGGYYVGRLFQMGYKVKILSDIHNKYGVHLRIENKEEWEKYF